MGNILQHWLFLSSLEWKKFSKNTVIIILIILYVLISPVALFTAKDMFEGAPPPFPSVNSFFEFPLVWEYQGYVASWFVAFILGFAIIYMFTSEVSNRTLRQNIITGLSKRDFFLSKITSVIYLSLMGTVLFFVSSVIIGLLHTPGSDMELIMDNNFALLRCFLMCLGYMSFALFLSVLIRKGMLVILNYFMYVNILEPLLRQVQFFFFKDRSMIFWPMNTFEDLFPLPFYRLPDTWIEESFGFSALQSTWEAIGFSSVYIVLFISLSWYFFNKKDV